MRTLPDPNVDFTHDFMAHALAIAPGDIEEPVRHAAKLHMLDTIGVALAAPCSISAELEALLGLLDDWGQKEESTVWSVGVKAPAWAAALVNGALAKGLDYDTTHPTAMLHPSGPVLPAALALAEARHVPGEELLTAFLLGEELMSRLGLAVTCRPEGWLQDWHTTILLGGFGAAAAASRILGLSPERAVGALGTVFTTAGGTMELGFGTGSTLRLVYNAFPGRDGVMAAMMAERGVLGPRTPLEGRAGLFAVYFGGSYDVDALYEDLGSHYDLVDSGFKPWPSCAATTPYIQVALELSGGGVRPDEVERIDIKVTEIGDMLCHPLEDRRRPVTVSDAKFSLPFAVGLALTRGDVRIEDYTEQGIGDREVLAMAGLVHPELDQDLVRVGPRAAAIEVTMRDGSVRRGSVDGPYGIDLRYPMNAEAVIEKFRGCAEAGGFSKEQADTVVEMVMGVEQIQDSATLAAALARGA